MVWTIAPISGTPSYACLGNTTIRNKVNEFDSAEVQCEGTFTCDTVVQIKEGATILFQGYVKESQMEQNGKLYKLTLVETAQDLKYNIVTYLGSRSFIRNGQQVYQLVDTILTGSGWVRGTSDSTAVTSIGFYNTASSQALYKLLKDMHGYKIWFTVTADGVSKQVFWGTYRTDRTGSPITTWISKQTEADSIDRNVTKITVYGENSSIYGSAGSGTKEKVYKYGLAKTASECTTVATKLLADIGTNKTRYVFTLPKTNTYLAGDLVKIGVGGSNYNVFDVTRTQSNTKIGIGASEVSYIDTLGTNLEEISGSIKTPTQKTYDGGEQSCNATTSWKQNITIPDILNVSDFKLKVQCKKFNATTNVSATTEYLSQVSQVNAATTGAVGSNLPLGTTYYPDYNGMYCNANGGSNMDGFQMGIAVGKAIIYMSAAVTNSVMYLEYCNGLYDTWHTVDSININGVANSMPCYTLTGLFSGMVGADVTVGATRIRMRFVVGSGDSGDMRPYTWTISAGRVTRHVHSLATQYQPTPQPYAITSFSVYCRGLLVTTINTPAEDSNYEVDITSYLINGDNNIEVRPNASGNINVTGSYYSV